MNTLRKWQQKFGSRSHLFAAVAGLALFAAIGAVALLSSYAATPTASFEVEAGSRSGSAAVISDAGASGSSAVKFGDQVSGFTVDCPLNTAAKSCWDAATGVQRGTGYTEAQILAGQSDLTKRTGNLTITTDGTVVDRMWIEGCVAVKANNVTIKNSLIHSTNGCAGGNAGAGPSVVNNGTGGTSGLQIIDTEIDAMNANYDLSGGPHNNYTCLRCNIHGSAHNLWADKNVVIQDSFLHDLTTSDSAGHMEGVDADSAAGPVMIQHNWIQARNSGPVTGAIYLGTSWGPVSKVTIDQNYLEGGAGADIGAGVATYTQITNNAFSPNNGYGGSQFIYGFDPDSTGNAWSNNYNSVTLAQLPRP